MKENDFLGTEDFDAESWIRVVKSLFLQQNYQKAIDSCRMALSMSPHCEQLWLELGNLFSHLKKFDEAKLAYLEGLKINPKDETIRKNLNLLNGLELN